MKELASIVDLSKTAAPYIGTNFFTSTSRYWSSTTYADNTSSAWFVYFLSGYSGNDTKTINYFVRCVR
ncbi:MAG: DUF1566 domain-containing protein [Candidatus Peribacteria bacterium]|nr:DUF1566 domain-containing protein [Candidatus Peribacteria bacterium]